MKKILFLDDDQTIVDFVKRVLDKQGYETISTTDFGIFFESFRDQEIDLVLLDICMPVMNGFQVFKELRDFKRRPVLFITGETDAFNVASTATMDLWNNEFSDGTTDILYKPFDIAILCEKVASLIGEAEDEP